MAVSDALMPRGRSRVGSFSFLPLYLLSIAKHDVTQIGLGDSETQHTGDEPGEMGEGLSVTHLGGACV